MLSSPRARAKSRLRTTLFKHKAPSRLQAKPTLPKILRVIQIRKFSNLKSNFSKIKVIKPWAKLPTPKINLQAIGLSSVGLLGGYLLLSWISPEQMADWPPENTFWPVVVLMGWNIFWLLRGLNVKHQYVFPITCISAWWLWLRLLNITTNRWLVITLLCAFLILITYSWLGEKYLFSRKSVRKGILR